MVKVALQPKGDPVPIIVYLARVPVVGEIITYIDGNACNRCKAIAVEHIACTSPLSSATSTMALVTVEPEPDADK